jgi:hypothetical protein
MARLKRASSTSSSKLYRIEDRIEVGLQEDLRHKVDERRAKRRLLVALLVGLPVVGGIVLAITLL